LDEIEEIGLLLKAAMRESERRLNDLLRPLGITTGQAEVLQILERYGPMSLGELGALLVAEGGHPSRLVDRMVNAGYVEREQSDGDRRRLRLRPTERGKELAVAAGERKRAFREWVASQVSSSEIAVGRAFLEAYLVGTELKNTVAQRRLKVPLA
jgi:DNA-binding MarR family transcriptional regulator